jgi:HSP20 family protein
MTLVRWDPLQELVAMSNRFNRTSTTHTPCNEDAFGAWAPPVDIFEQGSSRHPGRGPRCPDGRLDVRIENGMLTLQGERRQDTEVREENAHRLERVYGMFTRTFSLPTTVDAAKVTAIYKDGILEVSVPKVETAKPKQVEIKAA